MANIKELILSIEAPDASFDEKLAAITEMQATVVAMQAQEEQAINDNVDLIIEALRTIEAKVEAKLRIIPEKGEQGIQGQKGDQGDRGLDGAQGKDGKSGIDGKDGLDGKDGISVQDAKIDFDGSLVITLSDGREINVGEVVSVDVAQTIHKIQSGSGGDSQTTLNAIAALQATIATYGTMATQNANNVAITGGAINGTTVGATTPAAGTFTTLTAQTEVLRTTGNNLFARSQVFNGYWTPGGANITVTDNATTAPDSTTTAASIIPTVTNGLHRISNPTGTLGVYAGVTYTSSIYAKANGYRYLYINNTSAIGASAIFDVQAGTASATTGTATITSVGNGWYRCTATGVCPTTGLPGFYWQINNTYATGDQSFAGDGTSSIYLWGAQLEIGSSATTYVVTTTAGIWNIPSLSFASTAASQIGLQSDGSLYVQPAGTGALQAQATTSSATGGNARGANAVDWQTSRNGASQIASGSSSVVGGGKVNTAAGFGTVVGGGDTNSANGQYTFVGGGTGNTASSNLGTIVGGATNTASGYYNFIGAGFTNSGTSASTVTTQSGTMNGTTAVTLSGSNASIKVGQYITGTSIAGDTYVSAISGTSLTLSKVASGSSTSTLSFYTPHGVVVGGGNNQATGSYSFIGGGGDAGTAANRNVASGSWSTVAGGAKNTASGNGSFVGGGGTDGSSFFANTASGNGSVVVGGFQNVATATGSFVASGFGSTANGIYSSVIGTLGTTRAINGSIVSACCNVPVAAVAGVSQSAVLILGRQTTDATATVLTSDNGGAGTSNQVTMPNNSAYFFTGEVVAGVTGGGNTKGWTIDGVIKRGADAASTTLVGSTVTSMYADVGAATWTIGLTADTTNGGLKVTFTGQASTTIRTVCQIRTTEMTY